MLQLINFIPKTVAECRSLIETLQSNNEGTITVYDRYGCAADLTAEEARSLAELITAHIGYKAPAKKETEAPSEAPKTETKKPAAKKTTIKKTSKK